MPETNEKVAVNSRQVGGSHYRDTASVCPQCGGEVQHWDFAAKQGYLEGCITKYITRWRHKNGIQDLEKAQHFLEKLIAVAKQEESRK